MVWPVKKKAHYYHLSPKDFGDSIIFHPRNRMYGGEAPKVGRICVAPSFTHCLSAIFFIQKEAYLYRTLKKVQAHYPYRVHDSKNTKEKWLLNSTEFIKINTISEKVMRYLSDIQEEDSPFSFNFPAQRKFIKLVLSEFDTEGNPKKTAVFP